MMHVLVKNSQNHKKMAFFNAKIGGLTRWLKIIQPTTKNNILSLSQTRKSAFYIV